MTKTLINIQIVHVKQEINVLIADIYMAFFPVSMFYNSESQFFVLLVSTFYNKKKILVFPIFLLMIVAFCLLTRSLLVGELVKSLCTPMKWLYILHNVMYISLCINARSNRFGRFLLHITIYGVQVDKEKQV